MKKQLLAAALAGAISFGSSLVGVETIESIISTIERKDAVTVLSLMHNLTQYDKTTHEVTIETFELANRCRIIKALLDSFVANLEQAPEKDSPLRKLINCYILDTTSITTGYLAFGNGEQEDIRDQENLALKSFYIINLIRIADELPTVVKQEQTNTLTKTITSIMDSFFRNNYEDLRSNKTVQQKISELLSPILEENLEQLLTPMFASTSEEITIEFLKKFWDFRFAKNIPELLNELVLSSFFAGNYTETFGLSFE
ncbi:hypothetical protein KAT92_02365 [Candidatus Babeliales bacterium]|nr:hypothetical protein [Candidatus Babeliales bacterium]